MVAGVRKSRWTLANGEIVEFPVGFRQEVALRLVRPGSRLLDVGCGPGWVSSLLADRFEEVHGVDASERALKDSATRGVQVRRVNVDDEPLPYPDESFDAVLCLEVVEHVVDPRALASELARVLRPGGWLYLSTPNIRFLGHVATLVGRGRFPLTSEDPEGWQGGHLHFFTFADVEQLLRNAGFDEVVHHGLGRYPNARWARPAGRAAREFLSVGIFVEASRSASR